MIEHQFPTPSGVKRWAVDLLAAARAADVPVERLQRDATDMAQHFPRWLLVLVRDGQPLQCRCHGLYVFDQGTGRGARCVLCEKPSAEPRARAGWFGVLPPIGIDGLATIKDAIVARPPRRHVVGRRAALGTFMLVPLVVQYGAQALDVYYLPEFREIPGVPKDEYSHAFHMIGQGRMCLFAPGEWRAEMTCREVLQQRAFPHVIKFLNYANGKKDAFAIVTR
jgi:hypothetical protein